MNSAMWGDQKRRRLRCRKKQESDTKDAEFHKAKLKSLRHLKGSFLNQDMKFEFYL